MTMYSMSIRLFAIKLNGKLLRLYNKNKIKYHETVNQIQRDLGDM